MLKKMIVACIIAMVFTSVSFAGSSVDFNPGKWEVISTMEMAGGMSVPPHTSTDCITEKNIVPESNQAGENCVVSKIKTTGNTISWVTTCKSEQGEMKGEGKVTYSGDTFEGVVVMSMPALKMKMTSKMKGRRVGPCD